MPGSDGMTDEQAERSWIRIAEASRAQIEKLVQFFPAMKTEEQGKFVEMLRDLLYFEREARTFEKEIDLCRSRVVFGDSS